MRRGSSNFLTPSMTDVSSPSSLPLRICCRDSLVRGASMVMPKSCSILLKVPESGSCRGPSVSMWCTICTTPLLAIAFFIPVAVLVANLEVLRSRGARLAQYEQKFIKPPRLCGGQGKKLHLPKVPSARKSVPFEHLVP